MSTTACWRLERKLLKSTKECIELQEFPKDPQKYVFNLSRHTLSNLQWEILSLGPKFCICSNNTNQIEDEARLEEFFAQIDREDTMMIEQRGAIRADLVNAFNQYKRTPITPNFVTKNHLNALSDLKKNRQLIIQRPDKGSGIVVLERAQYEAGMAKILVNEEKFQQIDRKFANINTIENDIKQLVKELGSSNIVNDSEAKLLKPRGSVLPRLYGLPKVHKLDLSASHHDEIPFRPILSMVGSPYHALAKWLCNKLLPIRDELCRYTIKDSFAFVERIRNIEPTSNYMYSFDVSNLFTNVPLLETVEYLCNHITVSHSDFPIPMSLLRRLILICVKDVPFMFNEQTYKQLDGVAMGSPLGPLLADVFMSMLECTTLDSFINNQMLYVRYMDDTFVMSKRRLSKRQVLKKLNDSHPSISFTMEEEVNDRLAFLDIDVIRRMDGSFATRIHHKATWTGQYTNFHSFVPISVKRNIVRNLGQRIERLVSPEYKQRDREIIRQALVYNGYPITFLDSNLVQTAKDKTSLEESKKKIFLRMQFRGDSAAELFFRKIKRSLRLNCIPVQPIAIFTSRPLISIQVKDRLPNLTTPNVVYQFTCSSCKEQYIGQTERRLEQRVREHLPQRNMNGLSKSTRSSIADHIISMGHWENDESSFTILHKARNRRSLKFLEAVSIRKLKPQLNTQRDFVLALKLPWT